MGTVGKWYIDQRMSTIFYVYTSETEWVNNYFSEVYTTMGYRETVQDLAEHSMKVTVDEVDGDEVHVYYYVIV